MFSAKNDKDNEKRFEVVGEQSANMIGITVIKDTQTGISYIIAQGMNGLGITPLLDIDGKPMFTKQF